VVVGVGPGLVTRGGFLFGGCGLGAAISALEGTSGRQCVWATAQYLAYATRGEVVDVDVTSAVEGHQITQARAVCHVGNREILTVNAALTFKPAFAGSKTVYLFAYTASAATGFQTAGTWIVPGGTPTAGPLAPASGSGASQTFSAPFTNPGGASAFTIAYMLINVGFDARACRAR
jgi:hypothetical protein